MNFGLELLLSQFNGIFVIVNFYLLIVNDGLSVTTIATFCVLAHQIQISILETSY